MNLEFLNLAFGFRSCDFRDSVVVGCGARLNFVRDFGRFVQNTAERKKKQNGEIRAREGFRVWKFWCGEAYEKQGDERARGDEIH